MTSPIIGVTPSAGDNSLGVRAYNIAADYTTAVQRAGGIPVILPLHIEDISRLLDVLDGVVFSGGGDIEAHRFGQENHEAAGGFDAERDTFEIALMQAAFERDMPILAICRGLQVMNVARGGDLIQDIPTQTDCEKEHNQRAKGSGEHDIFQTATVTAGDNPVTRALGEGNLDINSFHHQALGAIAPGLEVVATSDDGIVEAVYASTQSHAVGTQWHPERLAAANDEQQQLFNDLVTAARTYASR